MNKNIECLIEACKDMSLEFKKHHESNNLIEVIINKKSFIFVNWTTPLNTHSIVQLSQDKDYFYNLFKEVIKMPKTKSYLDPYLNEKYIKYIVNSNISDISLDIEKGFNYPMIIKQNRGSWGINVFKVDSKRELEKALITIFNENSSSYDYIALAQEYIDIQNEFRVIFYKGELEFCYKKDIKDSVFSGNLSPFHQDGTKAILIKDIELLKRIEQFCKPLFNKLDIIFTGIDIAIDKDNKLWLIEANSAPGFDNIIKSGNKKVIIELYKKILNDFN